MMLTRSFTQSCSRVTSSAEYARAASTSHRRRAGPRASQRDPCRIFRHGARLPCVFATSRCPHRVAQYHPSAVSDPSSTRINPVRRTPAPPFFRTGRSSFCRLSPRCSLPGGSDVPLRTAALEHVAQGRGAVPPLSAARRTSNRCRFCRHEAWLEHQRVREHRVVVVGGCIRDVEICSLRPGSRETSSRP